MPEDFKPEKCEGAITALITPADFNDYIRLLEYQLANRIHGYMPCGTTGQSPTLNWLEHDQLISEAVKIADGKITVIGGAGSNNTEEGVSAVEQLKYLADMGLNGTLHVTGYYNCPSQQGFADYFSEVAKAVPEFKVIIYNIPGRGHPIIRHEVVVGLVSEFPNIIGTKDATGGKSATYDDYKEDGSYWKALRKEARSKGFDKHSFKIISGDDPATYRMMIDPDIEAVGVISVWSNPFPHAYSDMTRLILEGKQNEAKKLNDALSDLNSVVGVKITDGYYVNIGNSKVWVPGDNFRNPEAVQRAAYVLGMLNSSEMRSPMGFLPEQEWGKQVGSVLYKLYNGEYDIDPEYLFGPIRDFYKPDPPIGDRLMKYKPSD